MQKPLACALAATVAAVFAVGLVTLSTAVSKAMAANAGFHAASVFPSLKDGHPVAEVGLHKGAEWRTVTEKLE